MHMALGIGLLVLGVGGLGWWASGHDALRIQQSVTDRAAEVAAGSIHGAITTVAGRDIHLSGVMNDTAEQSALIAALNAVPGRRVVTSDATVLENAAPYTLNVIKAQGLSATGFVPTEKFRAVLASTLDDKAKALSLAAGAPDGWDALAEAGIAALGPLNAGTLSLSDSTLNISGKALGPKEAAAVDAAFAGLPIGSLTKDITLLDDGTPAAYTVDYSAANGASIAGKLPKGLDVAAIAASLGVASISGTVTQGLLGDPGNAELFGAFKAVLGQLETLNIAIAPDARAITATVQGDVDANAVKLALVDGLAGFDISADDIAVTVSALPGENGGTRINAATGANQRYMGEYWLDVPDIQVGLADCQSSVDRVLQTGTINFVTNSDALGDGAVKVINALGAVMVLCAEQGKLRAVIGGHTDASGDAKDNLGLSQRRAVTVRRELIARGVAPASLKAVGYGAQRAIADNATDAGKAKNRRTTIEWAE